MKKGKQVNRIGIEAPIPPTEFVVEDKLFTVLKIKWLGSYGVIVRIWQGENDFCCQLVPPDRLFEAEQFFHNINELNAGVKVCSEKNMMAERRHKKRKVKNA